MLPLDGKNGNDTEGSEDAGGVVAQNTLPSSRPWSAQCSLTGPWDIFLSASDKTGE